MNQANDRQDVKRILANFNEDALDQGLLAALYRKACPDAFDLGAYQMGLLAKTERRQLQTHLQTCPHCQAELDDLTEFMTVEWQEAPGFQWGWQETGQLIIRMLAEIAAPFSQETMPIPLRSKSSDEPREVLRHIILSPDEVEDLDLAAEIYLPQDSDEADSGCVLSIHVEIPSRLFAPANIVVQASAGAWQATGQTDDDGDVLFEGLPQSSIGALVITVIPQPE